MNTSDLYEHVFGEKYVVERYKFESHNFSGRICGKPYCVRCGLIALNNPFSQWSTDKGCLSENHPSYKNVRRKAVETN